MFDKKNDYAVNKNEPEAIVYKTISGSYIRLTKEDFKSEEEFQLWKNWSDTDYRETERSGRGFYDNTVSMTTRMDVDVACPGTEELFFTVMEQTKAEEKALHKKAELTSMMKERLTEKQYRRLCFYYLSHLKEKEIAKLEGVGQRRISSSLIAGRKIIKKIFEEWTVSRG